MLIDYLWIKQYEILIYIVFLFVFLLLSVLLIIYNPSRNSGGSNRKCHR